MGRIREFWNQLRHFGDQYDEYLRRDVEIHPAVVAKIRTLKLRGSDMTEMPDRVVVFRDGMNQWRWHRVAPNGRIVSNSGEGYHNKTDCLSQAGQVNKMPYILEVEGTEPTQVFPEDGS